MKSKSKSKTTPIVTEPMANNLFGPDGFSQQIAEFGQSDPTQYVAPASPLQQQAFDSVGSLGTGQAAQTTALNMAQNLPQVTAAQSTATGYSAPSLGNAATANGANIGPASNATATMAGNHSILDNGGVSKYMDPQIQALVDATMASYDAQTGRTRAGMEAQAAGSGAFGGSRYGIQMGQYDAETGRSRALTEAELRAKAYSDALTAAGMDTGFAQQTDLANAAAKTGVSQFNAGQNNSIATAQANLDQQIALANAGFKNDFALQQAQMAMQAARDNAAAENTNSMFNTDQTNTTALANAQQALQAAGLVSNIGTAQDTGARADVGLTAALGEQQRGITAEELNALPTQLQMMGQLYGSIPPSAYIGSNTKASQTAAMGPILGNIAGSAASAMKFSDRRLKRDITLHEARAGLNLYRYNYLWDGPEQPPHLGVMADEVAIHAPHALGPVIAGFATVDYSRL